MWCAVAVRCVLDMGMGGYLYYETRPAPQTSEHYVNIAALLYITIAKRGWPCAIVFLDTACRVRVPILALNIRPRHFISLP